MWERRVHPDDHEPARAAIRASLANPSDSRDMEFRLRHKDGSYRWILARGVVLYNDAGEPSRALGMHLNITERKLGPRDRRGFLRDRVLAQPLSNPVLARSDRHSQAILPRRDHAQEDAATAALARRLSSQYVLVT